MECLPWYSCLLCGAGIRDNKRPVMAWQRRFRMLYFDERAHLSGIGIYNKDQKHVFIVPEEENACSSDKGCTLIKINVMDQKGNELRGHIFHDSCWSLLKACNQNRPIDLCRLFQVFESARVAPFWCRLPTWGHSYGGLFSDPVVQDDPNRSDKIKRDLKSQAFRNSHRDPYHIPQVGDFPELQYQSHWPSKPSFRWGPNDKDCFLKLPQEILDEIVMHLPTRDAVRCGIASKVLATTIYTRRFWASKFEPGGECAFLFEAQRFLKSPRNWRSLHISLNSPNTPTALLNRKRIWSLLELVLEKLSLEWRDAPVAQKGDPRSDPALWQKGLAELGWSPIKHWLPAAAQVRTIHTLRRPINKPMGRLNVTLIRDGNGRSLVSGIELVAKDGTLAISMGYKAPWKPQSVEITEFRGFILSAGLDGVYAIRVVNARGHVSRWIGEPLGESSHCALIAGDLRGLNGNIRGLSAGFDGFRLTALALYWGPAKQPTGYWIDQRVTALFGVNRGKELVRIWHGNPGPHGF